MQGGRPYSASTVQGADLVAVCSQGCFGVVRGRRWGCAGHRGVPGSALRSTDSWLPRVLTCRPGARPIPSAPVVSGSCRQPMIASREAISRRR